MGTVKASELIKALHRAGRTSTLGRAIGELGRIAKSLFLLAFVDDEVYRRRVLTHRTGRVLGRRHAVAWVIYGIRIRWLLRFLSWKFGPLIGWLAGRFLAGWGD